MLRVVLSTAALALVAACASDTALEPAHEASHLSVSASAGPVVHAVTGSAHWLTPDGFNRRLAFNAREYQDGTIDGEWQLVAGAAIMHGPVTCFTVIGDEARVGAFVDRALFTSFLPGTDIGWLVRDGGEGAEDPSDQSTNVRAFRNSPPGTAAAFCETGETPAPIILEDIDRGNVQIH